MIGYPLTVAVSVAAGVAALTSAFPPLLPYSVHLALAFVALLTIVNLRGVRESGAIFSVPTYLFVGVALVLIVMGTGRILLGLGPVAPIAAVPLLSYLSQAAAVMILALAANTAFSDFPRLAYFLARDHFMPHQFSFRGDRLAFSTGIMALGGVAALLLVAFGASTAALIPL